MHAEEVQIDAPLVRRLISKQFPDLADLSIEPVNSSGTDNALFRLGEAMSVRMPRVEWTASQVEKEHRWLPKLAPHLPLAIPVPLRKGKPGEGYAWSWSIYGWLEGENPSADNPVDMQQAARDLANFLGALQRIDATDGPTPEEANTSRGLPLATRDAEVREAIAALEGKLDDEEVTKAWEASLLAAAWAGAPRWIHGDLQPGNLLAVGKRISAVIDFGCLTVGDPACDLMVAWNLLDAASREVLREALAADDANWLRGRGWALSQALIFIPYYSETNPGGVKQAWRVIEEVMADYRRTA